MKFLDFHYKYLLLFNLFCLILIVLCQPNCEPCQNGVYCPPCIGEVQITIFVIIIAVNVLYFFNKFIKRSGNMH